MGKPDEQSAEGPGPSGRPRRLGPRLLDLAGSLGFVALLAGTVLILSARWFWLGEVAVSFSWYFGWAGFLGALLLGLVGRRRLGFLAALVALFHLAPVLPLYMSGMSAKSPPEEGSELTVATFNLQWSNRDSAAFDEWLEWADADVICLQEVSPFFREHLEGLAARYPTLLLSPSPDRWNPGTWGTAILARVPIESSRLLEPPPGIDRPSMEAQLRLGGSLFTLRTAHPPRPGRGERTERRDAVLAQLAGEDWSGHGVLLGDLNVTSSSPVFGRVLAESGLGDSRQGFGRQPTWTTSKYLAGLRLAIDHVLVSPGLRVLDRRTRGVAGSDHRSVVVELTRSGS